MKKKHEKNIGEANKKRYMKGRMAFKKIEFECIKKGDHILLVECLEGQLNPEIVQTGDQWIFNAKGDARVNDENIDCFDC